MVLNNYRTMERVRELREEKLSPEIVLDLHRMITLDTLTDPKDYGRLRTSDENIFVADVEGKIIHTPPAADELEARLKAMCSFANGESPAGFLHPVVRAIALHFWLAYDHPFVDGNGRTARALFYWCMLNKGYWLCEFLSISSVIYKAPQQYYRAFLYTETDDNDLSYFILYHLEKISEALDELRKYLERSAQRLRQLDSLLHGSDEFNHRQRDLLRHALRHPGAVYYIRRHQRSHKVVYQTARADLLELAERHLLRKVKKGRAYGFIPMPRLEARLAALGTGTAGAPRKRL
jgi:Fic family protein